MIYTANIENGGIEVRVMLLNFRCDNFKAFRDGFDFNMIPEKRLTELNYSILNEEKTGISALPSSVIYGPNAAGKTSIVNAMSCLRQIVLRGSVEDAEDNRTGDYISRDMSLAPFAFEKRERPVQFDITFYFRMTKYRYVVAIYVGAFLQKGAERYIDCEQLYVNDKLVFDRGRDKVRTLSLKPIKDRLNAGFVMSDAEKIQESMSGNIVNNSLTLTTDFNSFCSKSIVSEVREWFDRWFIVINSSDRARFYPSIPENEGHAIIEVYINKIAQEAGIIGSDFAYVSDPETHRVRLASILNKSGNGAYWTDAERVESLGTLRLISIMPVVISALRHGATLVMDELDASLHPMIVMNLLSIFHNDEVNTRHSQLVFNTHNPIYLNHNLLRRDEIKFVERDKITKSSSLYALSDFKANGESSVRKTSDYMKNYFINRYGAIEDIDFTDIIVDVLKEATDD